MGRTKIIDGVEHVWDIMENSWVTTEYWEWVNGRGRVDPEVRTLDHDSKWIHGQRHDNT